MTIPFGRRRLILTLKLAPAAPVTHDDLIPVGADDRELAMFSRGDARDLERARWEGLSLLYGGVRRP